MGRLTDKQAIWMALCAAYQWEDNLVDAWTPPAWIEPDEDVKQNIENCKRYMAAFERVAQRYYGRSINDTLDEPTKGGIKVDPRSITRMLREE